MKNYHQFQGKGFTNFISIAASFCLLLVIACSALAVQAQDPAQIKEMFAAFGHP